MDNPAEDILKALDFESSFTDAVEDNLYFIGVNLTVIEDIIQQIDAQDPFKSMIWLSAIAGLDADKMLTLTFLFIGSLFTIGIDYHADGRFAKIISDSVDFMHLDVPTDSFWQTAVAEVFVSVELTATQLRPLLEVFWESTDDVSKLLLLTQVAMLFHRILKIEYTEELVGNVDISFTDYISFTMVHLREAHAISYIDNQNGEEDE